MMRPRTVFILSPAHLGGKRAQFLSRPGASFDLALRLQRGEAVALGEVYTFVSGLYFRGKLAYGRAFASRSAGKQAIYTITPNRGLVHVDEAVTTNDLREMSAVDIDANDARYHEPLRRDVLAISERLRGTGRVVLLGSIASGKYVDILLDVLGEKLLFPSDFVGRGDLSRGGLCLRAADSREELDYAPVQGAIRKGKRPPRLSPIAWKARNPKL
jgi:hypothetical protein